jgi:predicted MFS family arabinose efflux permease
VSVLIIGHVAGMVDMVALPLWVGGLMQYAAMDPARAGATVALFLFAVAFASVLLAPRLSGLPARAVAGFGFGLAAVVFAVLGQSAPGVAPLGGWWLCHALAGLGVGTGLTMVHGRVGQTRRPHRVFAMAGFALGLFGLVFYGVMPELMQRHGLQALFTCLALAMSTAALATALALPRPSGEGGRPNGTCGALPFPRAVWAVIVAVVLLTLNQAMVYGFAERLGAARGESPSVVGRVLLVAGCVSLLSPLLAGVLERRWRARRVAILAPLCQAALAVLACVGWAFPAYAAAISLYTAVTIFGHTFLFGWLARLDRSGRAVAATPAMVMLGSAIGPAVGGVLVGRFGFVGLGIGATALALLAVGVIQATRDLPLTSDLPDAPGQPSAA